MKLAFLTASYNENEKEEGFIVDWVDALAEEVEHLVLFTLRPPVSQTPKNVTSIVIEGNNKLAKLVYLWKQLSVEHQKTSFTGIFSHIFPFLASVGGVWGKTMGVKTIYWYAGGLNLPYFSLTHLAMRLNRTIITCSELEKKRYQAIYHLSNIYSLGHAINTKRFKPIKKRPRSTFTIGSVGRTTPNKNLLFLIETVSKVAAGRHITLKLALSRTKENVSYYHSLQTLAKHTQTSHFRIKFKEDLNFSHLADFYHLLDLYIHPSLLLSVDKAGLEAAASGVPVLLSKSGYQDVANKWPSILFDPWDQGGLMSKIEAFAQEKKLNRDQEEFQKFIRSEYSTKKFMQKLITLFNEE